MSVTESKQTSVCVHGNEKTRHLVQQCGSCFYQFVDIKKISGINQQYKQAGIHNSEDQQLLGADAEEVADAVQRSMAGALED